MPRKRMSPEDRLAARLARKIQREEDALTLIEFIWNPANVNMRGHRLRTEWREHFRKKVKPRMRAQRREHRKGRRHGR